MGKRWTQEEDNYLAEKVGVVSVPSIAKGLNRSINSIETRMTVKGLDSTKVESGRITAWELANTINVDSHTVYRWIKQHELPYLKKITRTKRRFYLIDIEQFWEWAEQNQALINFSKIESKVLLPEPEWVEEARRRDLESIPLKHTHQWTAKEESRLIGLVKMDYSAEEIAAIFNRTEKAIKRKTSRLREQNSLPYKKITIPWTNEEVDQMLKMEKQGYEDKEIAYELGRETGHIVYKRRHLREIGKYQGYKKSGKKKYEFKGEVVSDTISGNESKENKIKSSCFAFEL